MTTTTEIYEAPANTFKTTPELIPRLRLAERVAADFRFAGTTERKSQAEAMRELARLSREPDSLARDSEGNVWGFGADA
jgi:hypothetical protein